MKVEGFTLVELMIVISIVAILAAVAIPKILDVSQKAKASEFPTMLKALYTAQLSYQLEKGYFVTDFSYLKDSAGIDITSETKWFYYSIQSSAPNNFTGIASVIPPGFGIVNTGEYGTIDQSNSKFCTSQLQKYCPSWK